MKMIEQKKIIVRLSLLVAGLIVLILAACQPQVVEVEVTREVEVVVTVEVVKEVEIIKEVEVEVVKEVEVEAESAAEDTVETGSGGVDATGSEEDEGSPFVPKTGKVNSEQQVAQTVSWIESSGVITDPTTVRVIASRTDDVVLVMSTTDNGIEQEIIVTHRIRRYRQSNTADRSTSANRIYMEMTSAEWELLAEGIKVLISTDVSDDLACDFCAAGENGESYVLIIEDRVVRFEIDSGESVSELDPFLFAMRDLMESSSQQARAMWQRTE